MPRVLGCCCWCMMPALLEVKSWWCYNIRLCGMVQPNTIGQRLHYNYEDLVVLACVLAKTEAGELDTKNTTPADITWWWWCTPAVQILHHFIISSRTMILLSLQLSRINSFNETSEEIANGIIPPSMEVDKIEELQMKQISNNWLFLLNWTSHYLPTV